MEAAQKFIFGSKLNIATLSRFIALRLHTKAKLDENVVFRLTLKPK